MAELQNSCRLWKWKLDRGKTWAVFPGFYKTSISSSETIPRVPMTDIAESGSRSRYPAIPPRSSSLSRVPRLFNNRYMSSPSSSLRSMSLASTGTSLCSDCEVHHKNNGTSMTPSPPPQKLRRRFTDLPRIETKIPSSLGLNDRMLKRNSSRASPSPRREVSPMKSLVRSRAPSSQIFERDVAYQQPMSFVPRPDLKRAVSMPVQPTQPTISYHPPKLSLRALPQMSSTIVSAAAVRAATDELFKEAEEVLKKIAGEARIIRAKVKTLNQHESAHATSGFRRLWRVTVAAFLRPS